MENVTDIVGKAVADAQSGGRTPDGVPRQPVAASLTPPHTPPQAPSSPQTPVPITFTAGNAFKAGFFGALGILSAWGLIIGVGLVVVWLLALAISAMVTS